MKTSHKFLTIFSIATVLLVVLGVVGLRSYLIHRANQFFFDPSDKIAPTPDARGLAYSTLNIPVDHERFIHGWFVAAPDTSTVKTGVLVFHPNRVTVSDQLDIIQTLVGRGVSVMVFDYAGFGRSDGTASIDNARADAEAAFGVFADSMGFSARKYVMGTSLGAAIMLSAVESFNDVIDGAVVIGTFASGLELAVRRGSVPRFLSAVLPNPYDNVRAAGRLTKPLLVIHSADDELFPIGDAERIVDGAGGHVTMVPITGRKHAEYLTRPEDWEPVLTFLGPN